MLPCEHRFEPIEPKELFVANDGTEEKLFEKKILIEILFEIHSGVFVHVRTELILVRQEVSAGHSGQGLRIETADVLGNQEPEQLMGETVVFAHR